MGLRAFLRQRRGTAATEYGLISALIAVVTIGAITATGVDIFVVLGSVAWALKSERFANKPYEFYVDQFANYNLVLDGNPEVSMLEIQAFLVDYSDNSSLKKSKGIRDSFDCDASGGLSQSEWNNYGAHWSDPASGGPASLWMIGEDACP